MNKRLLLVLSLFVSFFVFVSIACSVDLGNTVPTEEIAEEESVNKNHQELDYTEVTCPNLNLKQYTEVKCYLLNKEYTSIGMVLYIGKNIEAIGVSFEANSPDYVIKQSAEFAFAATELTNWDKKDLQEAINKTEAGKTIQVGDIIVTSNINSSGGVMIIIAHD